VLAWLLGAALGPAAAALPVNWAADALATIARQWFRRLRHTDDLSRIVKGATGTSVELTGAEFKAVRKLLEDPHTWEEAGQGTVAGLADRIASCLPPRAGRTLEDSRAAALTIARGLLEFAVADLDPAMFQQVLMARIARMETDQASALDEALLGLHADLVARLEAQGELDAQRFATVMEYLNRALDRLPPGPAQRGEIVAYLTALIGWLNVDPWPRDRRFDGPALTAAALERELRIAGGWAESNVDADTLVQQCQRLVILAGPGSGKTWLAKRSARRCAEHALMTLAAGATLDEVELPLYTTCSRLFAASGDIRQAVLSSALDQFADLGPNRVSAAVRAFFAERNAPVLLVIDSLDEASGPDDRLRQADTLPWRIVLTSRPSSWNHQLAIKQNDKSRRIGELQSLRYPDDVVAFIDLWFASQPEPGHSLVRQLTNHSGLRQAATVPLILAFYCIAAGRQPLPELRRELYPRVLKRMLTGRWRDSQDREPDVEECLRTLTDWAWSGAVSDPVSGTGTWTDDISIKPTRLSQADRDALGHIATPVEPPDIDTGRTLRRFAHRSLREHLVAEHVAALPVDQAAEELLPHLWYDPDWEYCAAAALAAHPDHDRLLRRLLCRAANADQPPAELSVIDGAGEFRRLLARVADESAETDWSQETATLIGGARTELAMSDNATGFARMAAWMSSDRRICTFVLTELANETDYSEVPGRLLERLTWQNPTVGERNEARQALMRMWAADPGWRFGDLIDWLVRLAWTAEEKLSTRDMIMEWLTGHSESRVRYPAMAHAVAQLDATPDDKRQVLEILLTQLSGIAEGWLAGQYADEILKLGATPGEGQRVREALLQILAYAPEARLVTRVTSLVRTTADRSWARQVILDLTAGAGQGPADIQLLGMMAGLDASPDQKALVRSRLLEILDGGDDGHATDELIAALLDMEATPDDKNRALGILLTRLPESTSGLRGRERAEQIARLVAGPDEGRPAREALLKLLGSQTNSYDAAAAAEGLAQLDPPEQERKQARDVLLRLIPDVTDYHELNALDSGLIRLSPTAGDKREARTALLRILAAQLGGWSAAITVPELIEVLVTLAGTAEEKHETRGMLLELLASQRNGRIGSYLAKGVDQLDPTPDEAARVRVCLLTLLSEPADPSGRPVASELVGGYYQGVVKLTSTAAELVDALVRFRPTAAEKERARAALVTLLSDEEDRQVAERMAEALLRLDPAPAERTRAISRLGTLLDRQTFWSHAGFVAEAMVSLAKSADDKSQVREALRTLLDRQADASVAGELEKVMARVEPSLDDISNWRSWASPPTRELLAAVRRNSESAAWLAALPALSSLSG
jgi:hypothetical protein